MKRFLNREFKLASRYKNDISIIFFDIDEFKYVNDNFGHKVGDKILEEISFLISNNIREIDHFGRWGGDEFLIILPQTNKTDATNVVNHIQRKIKYHDFKIDNLETITCSFGTAEYEEGDTPDSLLKKADDEMYLNKKRRKRV